ncbi:MAG TPA: fluoride efflux transporter CrcB [Myxococcales bacterium]|nr:fluoride efflux transporter CrcB [Myxococcales bacterium]
MGRSSAILLVALGGAAGAVARFVVGDTFARRFGTGWPYGTLVINLSGCFAIALFLSAAAGRAEMSPGWRYLFPVGFVGAYTTFSTYEYEILRLFELGQAKGAVAYLFASNALGFCAVAVGAWLGRRI